MGQKVHPVGIRLGIINDWKSTWYAEGSYADLLNADIRAREFLQVKLKNAAVSRIQIERPAKTARITIETARPGVIIGKKGDEIELLRAEVTKILGVPTQIKIQEI